MDFTYDYNLLHIRMQIATKIKLLVDSPVHLFKYVMLILRIFLQLRKKSELEIVIQLLIQMIRT